MVSDKALFICRQNRDAAEVELANVLSEDSNNDSMSYVDYVSTQRKEKTIVYSKRYSCTLSTLTPFSFVMFTESFLVNYQVKIMYQRMMTACGEAGKDSCRN